MLQLAYADKFSRQYASYNIIALNDKVLLTIVITLTAYKSFTFLFNYINNLFHEIQ